MVPIQFKKLIRETCVGHSQAFENMLARSMEQESSNLSIVMCGEADLKACIQRILSVVPNDYLGEIANILTIDIFRTPITQKLRLLPLFKVGFITQELAALGHVKSVEINTLDVEDEFVFNGSRAEVSYVPSSTPKGIIVGGYLQITFEDGSVTVITISPEELEEARASWEQYIFGRNVDNDIYKLILLLRAFKTLLSFQGIEAHKAFTSLCEGLMGFKDDVFGEYHLNLDSQYKLSSKFAHFIGGERSQLEQIVEQLPTPNNVLLGKTVSPIAQPVKQQAPTSNVVNAAFGTKQGW